MIHGRRWLLRLSRQEYYDNVESHDEDDDEILVQPLPVGAGRRLVDSSSSESEDLCVTLMLLTSFLNINPDIFRRYAVSDDTEESDSENLSSNDDSSEHSSGDDSDVYERRHSTVLKKSIFLHCADCTYLNAAPSRSTRKQEKQIIG